MPVIVNICRYKIETLLCFSLKTIMTQYKAVADSDHGGTSRYRKRWKICPQKK